MKNKRLIQTIGLILYLVGMVLAFTILALSAWGELEASLFDTSIRADERLRSLNCPVFITRDEIGIITAAIENLSDRDVDPNVRIRITLGFVTLIEEDRQTVPIPANSTETLQWEVTEENAAYNRVIMARVYQFANLSLPSRAASCGIVVLPFSGPNGQQVFFGSLALSLVFMAAGLVLHRKNFPEPIAQSTAENIRRNKVLRAFIFLAVYLVAAALITLITDALVNVGLVTLAVISALGVFSFAALSK